MPEYRRVRLEGATVFITFISYNREPILCNPTAREILRQSWKKVSNSHPFSTDAICVLPDHIHTLMTLPHDDTDYSIRIREIKRLFTKQYLIVVGETIKRNKSHQHKKEATIWQRRFWEHTIRDEPDYQNHFDYIHYNPVKHGLVKNVSSWEWSSFHRYVQMGIYNSDWGEQYHHIENESIFGE